MEAAGYVLARGDRRDFLVIDQAGKEHSLARLISMKAAALRTFMKGIYAGSLPSVVEAKSRQMTRQVAQEAHQKHSAAERGAGQDTRRTDGPENAEKGAAKAERPLSAAIRRAWSLSRTGDQLTEALAARGIGLACVTAGEARTNHRRRAFAKQVGRYAQPLREGEIVAVNEQGYVFRFSPRTAGVDRGEIKKRLAGFEAGGLLSLSDTRQVMREVRADDPAATRLHSVTEARSQFKIDRRAIAAVHDELAQQQLERATEVTADPLQEREPADRDLPEPDGIATAAADIATKALNVMLDFAASFIAAPPPLTGEQLRERGEAAKDERGRQTARQETNERLATTVDMGRAARARADREEEEKRERQRRREQEEEYGRDR
jgi:hypothetical protein